MLRIECDVKVKQINTPKNDTTRLISEYSFFLFCLFLANEMKCVIGDRNKVPFILKIFYSQTRPSSLKWKFRENLFNFFNLPYSKQLKYLY